MSRFILVSVLLPAVADVTCHSISDMIPDDWCITNCNHIPKHCPADKCACDPPPTPPTPPSPPSPPSPPTPPPTPEPLKHHAIIGYWGSAADKPQLAQLPEALGRGYNVICVAFGDTLGSDGSFQIHTNLGDPPTKDDISKSAGVSNDSWQYLLSFGGQNAAGPTVTDESVYVSGFLDAYQSAKAKFGFDGIDIDIEANMLTPLLRAYRTLFRQLSADGEVISMAPQPPNIDPYDAKVFMEGSWNGYVPLVDSSIIDAVTYVAPQLYNNGVPTHSIDGYIDALQSGTVIDWDGQSLEVNIPSDKLAFGYPAAPGAGHRGAATPETIQGIYQNSSRLMATRGIMTWSIGWDASNGWKFIEAVKRIWPAEDTIV